MRKNRGLETPNYVVFNLIVDSQSELLSITDFAVPASG